MIEEINSKIRNESFEKERRIYPTLYTKKDVNYSLQTNIHLFKNN